MSVRSHDAGLASRAPNVLGNSHRLTQSSYREAISQTMIGVAAREGGLSDQDMADLLGTSAATVGNARNRKGDLSPVAMLSIGKAFGPASLSTVMALIGAKAVPVDAVCVAEVGSIPVAIAKALPLLMTLLADGQCCDADVRELDKAGVIDLLHDISTMLDNRRNTVRLRAAAS